MLHNFFSLLLQLSLAALALAAPVAQEVSATTAGNSWQYGTGGGILGFIVLILDIIVFSTYFSPQALKLQVTVPLSEGLLFVCHPFANLPV